MRMFKLISYSLLLAAIAAAFVFRVEIKDYIQPKIEGRVQEFEKAATDAIVSQIKNQIDALPKVQAPPPLRTPIAPAVPAEQTSALTVAGTITWTNNHRVEAGLVPLSENQQLDSIAKLRLEDMFAKQYFEHVSPTGDDVQAVAGRTGYEYIVLGENLALGGFSDDQDLVQAWMDSPGHRANILNEKYTEIGVAMRKGMFEGRNAWLAVQIFGKPLSLCPGPSIALKSQIETLNAEIDELQNELEARRAEIEGMNKHNPDYNAKVDEYNALVAQYNNLVEKFKATVADYNGQVEKFNECIAG